MQIHGLEVIFEDDSILVVNKPAGMLTIATETEKTKTAYAILRAYLNNKKRPEKLFIVHRLDREASGLLVFAKTVESKERLQDQFKDHSAGRRYAAVVEGSLSREPIHRSVLPGGECGVPRLLHSKPKDWKACGDAREGVEENLAEIACGGTTRDRA